MSRNVGYELNYTLRNITKERTSHLLRDGSLKSSIKKCICNAYRRALVDTEGRWAKRALLLALTNGTVWAMITVKDYTKTDGMEIILIISGIIGGMQVSFCNFKYCNFWAFYMQYCSYTTT